MQCSRPMFLILTKLIFVRKEGGEKVLNTGQFAALHCIQTRIYLHSIDLVRD